MKGSSAPVSRRPYWHIDAKWVCGILLFFALGASLLLYNLSTLTERTPATTISATIIANFISKNNLDDEASLNDFRTQAAASTDRVIHPVAEFPILSVTREQALTLPAAELRVALFLPLTEAIYDKGVNGAAKSIVSGNSQQEQFADQATSLGLFTANAHQSLQTALAVAVVAAIALMALLVWFSAGWGRLVSPGLLLILTSPVGTLMGLSLLHQPQDGRSPAGLLPEAVAHTVGNSLSRSYGLAFIIGAVLLIVALLGKVLTALFGDHTRGRDHSLDEHSLAHSDHHKHEAKR